MPDRTLRRTLYALLVVLIPVSLFSMRFDPYQIDGDAVAYMDIADLLHAHHWAQAVNGYWHPLYPACLALAQMAVHPTRMTELGAYYAVNWCIFVFEIAAVLFFCSALTQLRSRLQIVGQRAPYMLPDLAIQILGIALVVIAAQRELTFGKVRPDALLQALLLVAFAALLQAVGADSVLAALAAGFAFGLAYLTKSFAFVLALIGIAALAIVAWKVMKLSLMRALLLGAASFAAFAVVAGPYVAALSHQKHRLNFGDSGNLNYAWYVGHTEKMHLEPWMTSSFGSASVHMKHPETQLMASPGVYSFRDFPVGTYPPWFDTTYFNDGVKAHVRLGDLAHRDVRNLQLVVRYLVNHPEPWMLLIVLLLLGARFGSTWREWRFALLPVVLGLAIWALYGLVNVEERYVTIGYLAILLPLFAGLTLRAADPENAAWRGRICAATVVFLALLSVASMASIAAENRRNISLAGLSHAWQDPLTLGAADALTKLGYAPGTRAVCLGTLACLNDIEWARAADVRVRWEIYMPFPENLMARINALPNRDAVYAKLRNEGAQVIVGHFDPGDMNPEIYPAAAGWKRLGKTEMYALPLH